MKQSGRRSESNVKKIKRAVIIHGRLHDAEIAKQIREQSTGGNSVIRKPSFRCHNAKLQQLRNCSYFLPQMRNKKRNMERIVWEKKCRDGRK